jgi:hypothetical protein
VEVCVSFEVLLQLLSSEVEESQIWSAVLFRIGPGELEFNSFEVTPRFN